MPILAWMFQFHAGLIKSFIFLQGLAGIIWFQFHAGLIKSREEPDCDPQNNFGFNSMLV